MNPVMFTENNNCIVKKYKITTLKFPVASRSSLAFSAFFFSHCEDLLYSPPHSQTLSSYFSRYVY